MSGPLWANWLASYIFVRLFHLKKVFFIWIMYPCTKKSAPESCIFAGNCKFRMNKTRVSNEFWHKQSTTIGVRTLTLNGKQKSSAQGTNFSDFEALVDKSIRSLPLVALVVRSLPLVVRSLPHVHHSTARIFDTGVIIEDLWHQRDPERYGKQPKVSV